MARYAITAVIAGGTIRHRRSTPHVAPLDAARTAQRAVPTILQNCAVSAKLKYGS